MNQQAEENLQNLPDEEIFVIDREGSKTKKRKIQQQLKQQDKYEVSLVEKKLIEKIIKKPILKPRKVSKGVDIDVCDLWQDSSTEEHPTKAIGEAKSKKEARISISAAGQSYNPSIRDHQEILSKALDTEIKRRDLEEKKRTPFIPLALPKPTLDVADESEEEDGDDDDESLDVESNSMKSKMKERLTRSQRNKQKSKREAANLRQKLAKESEFLKSVSKLPLIVKELDEEEKLKLLSKEQKKVSEESQAEEKIDPSLVPLSDELSGSLRKIIPKGIALKVQSLEMTKKGLLMSRDRRRRQKHEKPHGAKRVIWVPKYKYK